MADEMKLLPCPFCGGEAMFELEHPTHSGKMFSGCGDCCAEAEPLNADKFSQRDQIAAWNRRASPPAREEAPAEGAGELDALLEEAVSCVADYDHTGRMESALRTALRARTSEPAGEAVALLRKVHSSALPIETSKTFDWTVPASVIKDIDKYLDTHPAPETADKLRVAKEALEPFAAIADKFTGPVVEVCDPHPDNPSRNIQPLFSVHLERAVQALAALNEAAQ